MNKKIENLKDLDYQGNLQFIANIILDAIKKKETDKLKRMAEAISDIAFYVNSLQLDRWGYNKTIDQYKNERNRAIIRARKAEKKIEELELELKKFNIFNKK
tara:strand:- start:12425 stop:12730 length:306 start_codon:yes stop_codon:yes gene_type:complete